MSPTLELATPTLQKSNSVPWSKSSVFPWEHDAVRSTVSRPPCFTEPPHALTGYAGRGQYRLLPAALLTSW